MSSVTTIVLYQYTELGENVDDGVKVGGHLVNADDQVMVVSSNVGLQRIMDALNKTTEKYE